MSARWARVEQVDEVAQADPLLVEQVVVLAGAVEPPAELEDAEVDRQEPVGVVEDERHVGHAERRSLVGAGEDHVLGLAAAKRPALLAERPAEGVGEVALAGAVRSDDRADPAAELDDRPLGEGLEALEPEGEQAGRARSSRRLRSRRMPGGSALGRTSAGPAPDGRRATALELAARSLRIALEGLGGGRGLGGPARRALAHAEQPILDPDLDPEELLVVRAGRVDDPDSRACRPSVVVCIPAADSSGS